MPYCEYSSAVVWLQKLIEAAHICNASDIHIDPDEYHSHVRLRVDGILREYETVPQRIHADGIGRLKILCQLKADEHMAPQDGRFRTPISTSHHIDIRVSIIPTYFGESAVLRLLRDTSFALTLSDLGISLEDQKKITHALTRSSGMILVTGPTGSGKTTTLYTLLKMLNNGTRSIITVEDPIEYAVPGTRQIQTNHARGLTFASGLRALVRQDPDVIMVGEIRDAETAHIAVHSALTGHLLLSTLHTTDAATAIPRLIDMGIEPYLIASTLEIIISQRLVRKMCPCKSGCPKCHHEGYLGRTGVYEVLTMSNEIRSSIAKRPSAQTIKTLAIQEGMCTMENDGLKKAEGGITSVDEVISALRK